MLGNSLNKLAAYSSIETGTYQCQQIRLLDSHKLFKPFVVGHHRLFFCFEMWIQWLVTPVQLKVTLQLSMHDAWFNKMLVFCSVLCHLLDLKNNVRVVEPQSSSSSRFFCVHTFTIQSFSSWVDHLTDLKPEMERILSPWRDLDGENLYLRGQFDWMQLLSCTSKDFNRSWWKTLATGFRLHYGAEKIDNGWKMLIP